MKKIDTIKQFYGILLDNCKFYKERKMNSYLLNEIGALRAVAYILEFYYNVNMADDNEFCQMIQLQNELLKKDL